MDKSKTIIFGMIALLATIGVVGILVLIALGRDVTAFVAVFVPLISSMAAIGGLGALQIKQQETQKSQGETIEAVAKNVNGNTTRMLDTIEKLLAERAAAYPDLRSPAETAPPISDDTVAQIRADAATLPSHAAEPRHLA